MNVSNLKKSKEKILLALLPFWTPQIPPLGISCLKGFLQSHGYSVTAVDINIEDQFKEIEEGYFDILKQSIPEKNRGNFHSVGQEILRNHMMAHQNYENGNAYNQLLKTLVFETFFASLGNGEISKLNQLIDEFYHRLEVYFTQLLEKEKPSVLGISTFEGTLPASLFAFKLARKNDSGIKTVMGGGAFATHLAMGSANFEHFLENTPYIDKIIVGEGEILFLKLLRGELPEDQKVFSIEDVNGSIMDLEAAVLPDFSDYNLERYPYISAYTSRSCPFQCSFCSETLQWGRYRKKTAEQITNELKELNKRHQRQLFLLGDSLLNPVIMDLAHQLVKENLSIYWDGYLRAGSLVCDVNNTQLWRRSGFYRARLGIESGAPHVLDLMGKKTTREEIKESIYNLAYAGIKTTTYWVVGHPGETEADFTQTLDLLTEMKESIYEAWCSPFYFYLTGQVNSEEWEKHSRLLYPENTKDMLMIQTWILDIEPLREEAYRRMNRFVQHCRRLGIPNPYSIYDFYQADKRWKKLHKNAVPSIAEFLEEKTFIDENRYIKAFIVPMKQKKLRENITFDF